jgi:hypothetical protein
MDRLSLVLTVVVPEAEWRRVLSIRDVNARIGYLFPSQVAAQARIQPTPTPPVLFVPFRIGLSNQIGRPRSEPLLHPVARGDLRQWFCRSRRMYLKPVAAGDVGTGFKCPIHL